MTPLLHQVPLADPDALSQEDLVAYLREAVALVTVQSEQLATQSDQLARMSEQLATLKKVVWFWEFDAVKSSGAWTVSGTLAQWGFAGDYPPHPEWDIVLYNDGLTYDY